MGWLSIPVPGANSTATMQGYLSRIYEAVAYERIEIPNEYVPQENRFHGNPVYESRFQHRMSIIHKETGQYSEVAMWLRQDRNEMKEFARENQGCLLNIDAKAFEGRLVMYHLPSVVYPVERRSLDL